MSAQRRIIPISSGKGGVGKTTVAVNYALSLSRYGPTILVDLDTGTSSVRSSIDTPVTRDLYHFFKKGYALADCVTRLDGRLDPDGQFGNFGFIASPKHLIEDITNFSPERREQVLNAINTLPATFVVLDLKAGLDVNVISFLPYSNSGILLFTPHLPAATLAAADIVKAILFRKLRAIFARGSAIYTDLRGITPTFVNSLIDRVEDVYDSSVHNLDAFTLDLQHALGDHPVVRLVASAVDSFVVHFVLNMFNGVQDSYDTAVRPFVESLAENVSAHMSILNLGWVIAHPDINRSNIRRVPIVLAPEERPAATSNEGVAAELARLSTLYLGNKQARPANPKSPGAAPRPDPSGYLEVQLDTLTRMYEDMKGVSYRDNFRYIASRSVHVMASRRTGDFGDTRLFKSEELQEAFRARGR